MVSSVSSADAPYGRIGQYAYASAKQADAAKQALATAADSEQQKSNDASLARLKDAANNFNAVYGGSTASASSSAAVTAQNVSETSTKDAPFGKIGNYAFSSAEQASKVKAALGNAASSAPANPLANSNVGSDKAGENAAASNLSAQDEKTAAAFENLSKANAAYRSFAEKGVEAANGSNDATA